MARTNIVLQVLMNEEYRDMYNRFGGDDFEFDPRKDEIKLITDLAVEYIFLGITAYLMTLPAGARASRTWITIIGILMLATEVTFKLTDAVIPNWMPQGLTEYELVYYIHSLFPLTVALLRILAETLYIDADQTSLSILKEVYYQQKVFELCWKNTYDSHLKYLYSSLSYYRVWWSCFSSCRVSLTVML